MLKTNTSLEITRRPRRLRNSAVIRQLVSETTLTPQKLVMPLFIIEGRCNAEPIESMPGQSRFSIDLALDECRKAVDLGVRSFALFPALHSSMKTPQADEAVNPDNLLCVATRMIKESIKDCCVITDVALDPYSSMGHDGLIDDNGIVCNDETVQMLAQMAVLHADSGADIVAPSDMMDGRVGAIRTALDDAQHTSTLILSYTAKYASAFYGPFRGALDSAPATAPNVPKDKRTYQMDPANSREASIEAQLDIAEGADMLMVKPALPYLDIIARLRSETNLPIAAYNVSGEYAMIKAAAQNGWLDERSCTMEALISIARAGADFILTYSALDYARWWREDHL